MTIRESVYCPECGGLEFSGDSLKYEHSNVRCSMRWNGANWEPAKIITESSEQEAANAGTQS